MAVSIAAAIFLVLLYCLIFSFSEQDGETSGNFSFRVTQAIIEGIGRLAGGFAEDFKASLIAYWEHPVRKLAHFSEYAVMGSLVYLMLRPWKQRDKKICMVVVVWVFLSAAADEFHQLFVDGRCGNFADVLLDTAGGGFGTFLCALIDKIVCKKNSENKRQKLTQGETCKIALFRKKQK